jgi:hypothetical protein
MAEGNSEPALYIKRPFDTPTSPVSSLAAIPRCRALAFFGAGRGFTCAGASLVLGAPLVTSGASRLRALNGFAFFATQ